MAGHDHGAMIADFLRRFWLCLALSVPLVAGSMMFQDLVGYHFTLPYHTPVLLGLATAIYLYGGWPFLSGTVRELRQRQPGMMTLVAVAITVAYGYSVAVTVGWLRGMDLLLELATLIDIMLLGHYLEIKSVAGASHALELLVQLLPAEAHKKDGDNIQDVKVTALACPHALGVAIPLVVAISTAISARKGLLIRNRTAFEEARKITAMVFDKTGTLTEGAFGVTRVQVLAADLDETTLLGMVAALEQQSQHPIAQGIVREAQQRELALAGIENFQSLTGKGVSATVAGRPVVVASPGYLTENNITPPPEAVSNGTETVVFVLRDGQLPGYVALADRIRADSKEAVQRLKAQGIKVSMATSDNQQVADAVARELELDGVYAQVLPDQKVKIVRDLQAQGQFVAMTGDGVNDAPALAQAIGAVLMSASTVIVALNAQLLRRSLQ